MALASVIGEQGNRSITPDGCAQCGLAADLLVHTETRSVGRMVCGRGRGWAKGRGMDGQISRSAIVTVPNAISLARLCAVPAVVWLIVIGALRAGFWLFLAAGISDALDGYLARRGARSHLGAVLDPLADKLLLVSVYVVLAAIGRLPDWLAILVVFRDVVIVGGALVLNFLGHVVTIRPLLLSKVNTAAQIGLIGVVLMQAGFGLNWAWLTDGLIAGVAVTTAASGVAYVWREALGGYG